MKNDINFEDITLRVETSFRGGGIDIRLDTLGFNGERMTAFQNYLGGGMLGSIQNDCTVPKWHNNEELRDIANSLAEYFHSLTNHEDDEWESATFEENQNRPKSAY